MKKYFNNTGSLRFLLPFFLFLFCLLPAVQTNAANPQAEITSCKLISSSKIRISATLSDPASIPGTKCYLFALPLSKTKLPAGSLPLQTRSKAKKMTFSVSLKRTQADSRLYSNFILAARQKDGSYTAISRPGYLTNPGRAAKYRYHFPTAVSKKGLQVSASMLEDAAELNVRHSVLNIVFTELISTKAERSQAVSIPYKYHGKTYWFRKAVVENYDRQLIALKESGTVVSAVLLLGWREDLRQLIYPSGRTPGHAFYAWNTSSASAREQLQATLSFLAHRYTASPATHGRIVNWIVGNEVNNYGVYNYAGEKTPSQYAQIYANSFRLAYNTISSVYSNARVYISLDHLWNTNWVSGTFASRKMLDSFAKALDRGGRIPWNLAYHPYSSPLTEPKFWANTNEQLTESLSSPVINMGNLGLLTSYIRSKYGENTRIILSEQGFTSVQNGRYTGAEQAAAIAYSYYLTEADDMVDSFIMNRHVDHQVEIDQGLNLGLWTTSGGANPEWASQKKESWNVFKYMDTNQSKRVTKSALPQIGISKWSEVIKPYQPSLYTKTSLTTVKSSLVADYQKKYAVSSKWKAYGAALSAKKTGSGSWRITHDNSRNRNALWGFTQSFPKKLSFGSASHFCATLRVSGSTTTHVFVKLRFLSGNAKILETSLLIPAGQDVRLWVPLKDWKYRKSVTKIQITLAPANGGWKNGATLELKQAVRAA